MKRDMIEKVQDASSRCYMKVCVGYLFWLRLVPGERLCRQVLCHGMTLVLRRVQRPRKMLHMLRARGNVSDESTKPQGASQHGNKHGQHKQGKHMHQTGHNATSSRHVGSTASIEKHGGDTRDESKKHVSDTSDTTLKGPSATSIQGGPLIPNLPQPVEPARSTSAVVSQASPIQLSKAQTGMLAGGICAVIVAWFLVAFAIYYFCCVVRKRRTSAVKTSRLSIKDREDRGLRTLSTVYTPSTSFGHCSRSQPSDATLAELLDPFRHQGEREQASVPAPAARYGRRPLSPPSILESHTSISREKQAREAPPAKPSPRFSITRPDSTTCELELPRDSTENDLGHQDVSFEIDRCLSFYIKKGAAGTGVDEPMPTKKSLTILDPKDSSDTSLTSEQPAIQKGTLNKQGALLSKIVAEQAQREGQALGYVTRSSRLSVDTTRSTTSTLRPVRPARHSAHTIRRYSSVDRQDNAQTPLHPPFEFARYGDSRQTSSDLLGAGKTDDDAAKRLSRRSVYSQDSSQTADTSIPVVISDKPRLFI